MKAVSIDAFCRLKFLSRVSFSPEGRSACLVVTEIDKAKDEYRSCLWLRRDGKLTKLTGFGEERSFQYLDEDTVLFWLADPQYSFEGATGLINFSKSGDPIKTAYINTWQKGKMATIYTVEALK